MRLSVCCARCASRVVEQIDHVIDFMQHLLEPQLIDLVNDDEEHFIVFGSLRAWTLQREQLIDRQIRSIGDRTVVHHHSLQGCVDFRAIDPHDARRKEESWL